MGKKTLAADGNIDHITDNLQKYFLTASGNFYHMMDCQQRMLRCFVANHKEFIE